MVLVPSGICKNCEQPQSAHLPNGKCLFNYTLYAERMEALDVCVEWGDVKPPPLGIAAIKDFAEKKYRRQRRGK